MREALAYWTFAAWNWIARWLEIEFAILFAECVFDEEVRALHLLLHLVTELTSVSGLLWEGH
jgi:hypothetical protein